VKIGDFGISKRAEDGAAISSTLKGTPAFMAPELHGFAEAGKERSSDNAQAADMWSLGELVFQMLTKEPTFKNMGLLFNYVQNPESFPSAILHAHNISLSGLDFIKSTMTPSPEKRPAADIALHHNWMEPHRPSSPRPSSITSIEY
jgi:serine/threonine protein kinase